MVNNDPSPPSRSPRRCEKNSLYLFFVTLGVKLEEAVNTKYYKHNAYSYITCTKNPRKPRY
ncbi:MAG: hypothetical protein WBF33_28640 [Candidatus Nitrosopolaris sp.]